MAQKNERFEFLNPENFISKLKENFNFSEVDIENYKINEIKQGKTDKSSDIYYFTEDEKNQVQVICKSLGVIVKENSLKTIDVYFSTEINKELAIMLATAVRNITRCIGLDDFELKYNLDSNYSIFPYKITCIFEEAYNFPFVLNDLYDPDNQLESKKFLDQYLKMIYGTPCEYKLSIHSITKTHNKNRRKEIINIRYWLYIIIKEPENFDYNGRKSTPFQVLNKKIDLYSRLNEHRPFASMSSIFPFLASNNLKKICDMFNEDYSLVVSFLRKNIPKTREDFENWKSQYLTKEKDNAREPPQSVNTNIPQLI